MTRWLLDTDILLDVAVTREPHAGPSTEALSLMREGSEQVFMAWHTVSNLYYRATRESNRRAARFFIATLTEFIQIAETGTDDLRYALDLPMADFEDAMQVAAARACDARFIVTRNVRDFAQSPIPALSPAQALAELSR